MIEYRDFYSTNRRVNELCTLLSSHNYYIEGVFSFAKDNKLTRYILGKYGNLIKLYKRGKSRKNVIRKIINDERLEARGQKKGSEVDASSWVIDFRK